MLFINNTAAGLCRCAPEILGAASRQYVELNNGFYEMPDNIAIFTDTAAGRLCFTCLQPRNINAWVDGERLHGGVDLLRPAVCGNCFGSPAISRRLLDELDRISGLQEFVIGRVCQPYSGELKSFATIVPWKPVRSRTGPAYHLMKCPECGWVQTFEEDRTKYLLAHDVADRPVVIDQDGTMYVSPAVFSQIDPKVLGKKFVPRAVPVLERPRDGLRFPGDPSDWDGFPVEEWPVERNHWYEWKLP